MRPNQYSFTTKKAAKLTSRERDSTAGTFQGCSSRTPLQCDTEHPPPRDRALEATKHRLVNQHIPCHRTPSPFPSRKRESNEGKDLRQLPHVPETHLMPTRSPTLTLEFSAPGPSFTTFPTPSCPPTWPSCVGCGSATHYIPILSAHSPSSPPSIKSPFFNHTRKPRTELPRKKAKDHQEGVGSTHRVLHNPQIRMAHPRMRQLHKHLPGPRRGGVERGDGGADAAGVVVDGREVLLGDGDVGGCHLCLLGGFYLDS